MDKPKALGWVAKLPEGFGWQGDGTFRLPLDTPLQHGKEQIAELRFRRPTVKDMRSVPVRLESYDGVLRLVATLTQTPNAVLDTIGGDDLHRVIEVGAHFLEGSLHRIGATA